MRAAIVGMVGVLLIVVLCTGGVMLVRTTLRPGASRVAGAPAGADKGRAAEHSRTTDLLRNPAITIPLAELRPLAQDKRQPNLRPMRPPAMTWAAQDGPYVAVDHIVYRLDTGERTGRIPQSLGTNSPSMGEFSRATRALNRSGTLFAVQDGSRFGSPLLILSTDRVRPLRQVDTGPGAPVLMEFVGDDGLVWVGRLGNKAEAIVIDAPSGAVRNRVPVPQSPVTFAAVSHDGQWLAVSNGQSIEKYNFQQGGSWQTLSRPTGILCGLAFSPCSEELAAVFRLGVTDCRINVWNSDGQIVFDHLFRGVHWRLTAEGRSRMLQWMPDGNRWLLGSQTLLDRSRQRILWFVQPPPTGCDPPLKVLSHEHLLTYLTKPPRLQTLSVPLDDIERALAALDNGSDAILQSGDAVSVRVDVAEVRFATADEVRQALTNEVTALLEQAGYVVRDGADSVFSVSHRETTGAETRIYEQERQRYWRPGNKPQDTGRTTTQTTMRTEVRWTAERENTLLFHEIFLQDDQNFTEFSSANDPFEASNWRQMRFRNILSAVGRVPVPSFVPRDQSVPCLPLRTK